MNSLNTLYFPGTAIHSLRGYPIFLLFQNVHLLAPVESDPTKGGEESPDSFIKSGFCQVHTPCPLGEDRNRFLRLVSDIKNRKDDYAAQLSSLTLAAMTGTSAKNEEESERSIVRSLFPSGQMPPETQARENRENLWQARLLLAIAELLDQEEEEIALNLAVLEDEEKELFQELQGEDDKEEEENPFVGLTRLEGTMRGKSAAHVKLRYTAWKTLYLSGDMEECGLFLAGAKESGDILLEAYQQKTGQQAPLVAGLKLPLFVGWNSGEASTALHNFTTKNTAFLTAFEESLVELTRQTILTEPQVQIAARQLSLAESWEKLLAADFPAEQFGRIPCNLYLFPGLSCKTLIGNSGAAQSENSGLLAVIG